MTTAPELFLSIQSVGAASRAQAARAIQADLAARTAPLDPGELNKKARAMQAEFAARGLPIDLATAVQSLLGEAE